MEETERKYKSVLDNIHFSEGKDICISRFDATCRQNRKRASMLINDQTLTYPTLYLLEPKITPRMNSLSLNRRNSTILTIIHQIRENQDGNRNSEILSGKSDMLHNILLWAVKTGWDFYSDDLYDEIMDIIISVLLHTYNDKSVIVYAEKLIFLRNENGKNIHGLVWSYFRIHDPDVLRSFAKHLCSENTGEKRLAETLLQTDKICKGCGNDAEKQCSLYLQWLKENDPYLYFTEESFQFSGKPEICKIDKDRKFLHRKTEIYEKNPIKEFSETEKKCINEFRKLTSEEKEQLCSCSHKIYRKDHEKWKRWLEEPIEQKLNDAQKIQEELL